MTFSIELSPSFVASASAQTPVTGYTHDFYRYPARFSPELAGAAIQEFTSPGEIVLDPFMGAGTSMVESIVRNRSGIGSDINELGVFLARVKTSPLRSSQQERIKHWLREVSQMNLSLLGETATDWRRHKYFRNLNCPRTWPIRDSIGLVAHALPSLPSAAEQDFCRCVLLRTAQWAIDGRRILPSAADFRRQLLRTAQRMLSGLSELNSRISPQTRLILLNCRAERLRDNDEVRALAAPRLILTSPPYPGVHVLYHRWQLLGGLETPAPYWIADCNDGQGGSYYTFGDRRTHAIRRYFSKLTESFSSAVTLCDSRTTFVQVVGFSNPRRHLPRYLAALREAGLREMLPSWKGQRTKRLWRQIPNRRWYNWTRQGLSSEKEVVLFHRRY
jgi:hypothetical protein